MISKELDPFVGSDKFSVAGRRAEEQMAHYLRRFFAGSPDIDVLNYLRIQLSGEVAQMDHLMLHPFGLTIVESKSIAGSVQIKDDGQWIRWFNKQPQGMRSPVTQAKMQAMLLRELLARTVKQKGFFDTVEIDVMVAISDSGTIQWPGSGALVEVCKADQVPEKILQKLSDKKLAGATPPLSLDHIQAISGFLRSIHQPLKTEAALAPASQEPAGRPAVVVSALPTSPVSSADEPPLHKLPSGLPPKVCKHCGGTDLEAQYGKFGYYFACKGCERNTGIKFSCPRCAAEGRVRKQGKDFFAECKVCDASTLYHSNS